MPTVLRAYGLRVIIWPDDHAPPHVHVFSGEGSAKIALTGDAPRLLHVAGMNRRQTALALKLILAHEVDLLNEWEKIHGPSH